MEYRSFADLADTLAANQHRLPEDLDLIVGIPRSGLLAANMLALQSGLPFLDLPAFLRGDKPTIGRTAAATLSVNEGGAPKHALILDDSISSGLSMLAVKERVDRAGLKAKVTYAAVYGERTAHDEVDLCFETVSAPRLFQWNLSRHSRLGDACLDIDGVLCHDPDPRDNDDGPRYKAFLNAAKPLHLPKVPVKYLVTSRLEKYRAHTERWLAQHGVHYEKLYMLDLPNAEARREAGAHAAFKAKVYKDSGCALFIESEERQACDIAELSGLPVLSIETHSLVWPANEAGARRAHRKSLRKSGKIRRSATAEMLSAIFGEKFVNKLRRKLKGR